MKISARTRLAEFIVVLDDAIPVSVSDRMLSEFAATDLWQPATVDANRSGHNIRNCDVIDLSDDDVLAGLVVREQLLTDATALAADWASTYEQMTSVIGLTGRTGLGLARYREGGFYHLHQDNHTDEVRTVTAVAVLYSDFEGGELSFFGGDHVVDLDPGQVCLFPSTFQYPHSVEAVRSGIRYTMLTWLN
jgi:2OG-Fe(II) oxygenase superfamily